MRTAGKLADLSMALEGRFTGHHALLRRLQLDRIKLFSHAVGDIGAKISPLVARYAREAELPGTIPGFGDVVTAGWPGSIGPAPHRHLATAGRLASWVTLCPGNYISARKSRGGRTGDGGSCIKPLPVQAAWAAVRVPGRLQARFHRLVRKFGGPKNKGARKRAIIAIAHTLLKIAYAVLKSGRPCQEPGADFCTRRESAQAREEYLLRQLLKLRPGLHRHHHPPRRPPDSAGRLTPDRLPSSRPATCSRPPAPSRRLALSAAAARPQGPQLRVSPGTL